MLSTLTSKLLKPKCQLAISYISDLDKPPAKKEQKKLQITFQIELTSNVFCSSEGLNLPPSPSIGVIKPEKDLIETISVLSLP